MTSILPRRVALVAGFFVLAAILALYLWTLDDGLRADELAGGDLITHHYAQVQARPANAPGYPLYTMGGWLWFHLGRRLLGDAANPISLLSAYSTLWALLALSLLYRLILEVTQGDWPVAALGTAFYAVTYFFWYYAVTAEQYASAVLQTLAMVWVAFRWEEKRDERLLLLLAFLCGLALAHLVTVLLIAPPLAWFILTAQPDIIRRARLWLRAAALALLPLVSYAYVYLRGAQHPEWRGEGDWPNAWAWFWQFVSTRQGRAELTWTLGPFTREFPALIWGELTVVGLVLGLVGLAWLGRRRAVFLYATLALYFAFSYVDRFGNWFQVIMPAYPLVVLGLAAVAHGVARSPHFSPTPFLSQLWERKGTEGLGKGRRIARFFVLTAFVLLVAYRFALSYPRADSSQRAEDNGLVPGWAILADEPEQGAAVFGIRDEALALGYLADIWGARPDVRPVSGPEARSLFRQGERPLYVTRAAAPLVAAEISPDAHLSSVGLMLIRVRPNPWQESPSLQHRLDADLGDGLRLLGFEVAIAEGERGRREGEGMLRVALYWQAVRRIGHDYTVSVRPSSGGEPILIGREPLQQDHPPVWGFYPTTRWTPGEVVRDDYALALPPGAQPDGATVVVYRALAQGGYENLAVLTLAFP
jgi:hypothetical protein